MLHQNDIQCTSSEYGNVRQSHVYYDNSKHTLTHFQQCGLQDFPSDENLFINNVESTTEKNPQRTAEQEKILQEVREHNYENIKS